MTEEIVNHPMAYTKILEETRLSGFTMASEILTCALLRTLAASKPSGRFLELGTGTGLSTAWILDGIDEHSTLVSVDNDQQFLGIANTHLGDDGRLQLILSDGGEWLEANADKRFDFIFADTWHGKYLLLEETLSMLNKGGWYIIDDMLPQQNWPDGHHEKVLMLVKTLDERRDLRLAKMNWASGIIVAVKK